MMKIAFWGLGSIAKRHIINLHEILNAKNIKFQVDIFRHADVLIEDPKIKLLISNVYVESQIEGKNYDIIFITNPTSMHYGAIKKCVCHSKHLFVEKPVFERCDLNIKALSLNEKSVYYVACPLRYSAVIQYVKKNINLTKVYCVRAISSSYLPDWRPEQDYRKTYSAQKVLGGGAAIDLIHEWDYLIYLFGFPKQVKYAGGKFSSLDIDSDDLATYIGIYEDKLIELHLDYFGRKTIRELILYTEDDTIIVNIINNKIIYQKGNQIIEMDESRNEYQIRELEYFLDIIDGKCKNENTIEHALAVLRVAENYEDIKK